MFKKVFRHTFPAVGVPRRCVIIMTGIDNRHGIKYAIVMYMDIGYTNKIDEREIRQQDVYSYSHKIIS